MRILKGHVMRNGQQREAAPLIRYGLIASGPSDLIRSDSEAVHLTAAARFEPNTAGDMNASLERARSDPFDRRRHDYI